MWRPGLGSSPHPHDDHGQFTEATPTAVATQVGGGAFTPATPGSQLTLMLPPGTTRYAIAYVCPPAPFNGQTYTSEFVVEATTQDPTAYSVSCSFPSTTGTATGSILNAGPFTVICGRLFCDTQPNPTTSPQPFSALLPTGPNDIAVVDLGQSRLTGFQHDPDIIKILRAQSVPGPVNGGNPISFASGDGTTLQSITVSGVPAGSAGPCAWVSYNTANGTSIALNSGCFESTHYMAVGPADIQPGDFYRYDIVTQSLTGGPGAGITQTTTAGGGPVSIGPLPARWSFAGPSPARFPTFTFNYSGFSGMPAVAVQASICWTTTSNSVFPVCPNAQSSFASVTVMATATSQNGASTITIPDLTSVPGFLVPAAPGTNISWTAQIFGSTQSFFPYLPFDPFFTNAPNAPANDSISFVLNGGNYTQP